MTKTTTPETTTLGDLLNPLAKPAGAKAGAAEAEVDLQAQATPEQVERAANPPAGLRGKALAVYVITGRGSREQVEDSRAKRRETAPKKGRASGPREGSALHAAITVLRDATEPMTPQEIFDAASKRGLVKNLKGKTPVATLAAQLAVQNKQGRLVERPQPGRYVIRAAA